MTQGKARFPIWGYFAITNFLFLVALVGVLAVFWPRSDATNPSPANAQPQLLKSDRAEATGTEIDTVPAGKQLSAAEVVAAVKPGVVIVKTYNSKNQEIGFASGFVVTEEGLIATNFHVLDRAWSADVLFSSGDTAKVKGVRKWDLFTDLALLDVGGLPDSAVVLPLDGTDVRTDAEEVLAIGHPKGLRFTTSKGILSGVYTEAEMPREYRRFLNADFDHRWLQHSASITGGSSGGPLLNLRGEVIGVNSSVSVSASFAVDGRHLRGMLAEPSTTLEMLQDLTGPGEELDRLTFEFQAAANSFNTTLANMRDEKARNRFSEEQFPAIEYADKMLRFARQHPDSPNAFEAVDMLCVIASQPSAPDPCDRVLLAASDFLVEHYADDPRVADLVWNVRQSRFKGVQEIAGALANRAASQNLRAICYFCEGTSRVVSGSDKDLAAAKELFSRVIRDHPNETYQCRAPQHPEHRLADESKAILYQLENRTVGN